MNAQPTPQHFFDLVAATREQCLANYRAAIAYLGKPAEVLIDAIGTAATGGKGTRAKLVWRAWQAYGADAAEGALSEAALAQVAASIELFHDSALVHDDLVDRSDTRRGRPALHCALATQAREEGWLGDPDQLGEALALLAGDAIMDASQRVFQDAVADVAPAVRAALTALHHTTRAEVLAGQFADVLGPQLTANPLPEAITGLAWDVIRAKTARYTVATPLAIGATAAGASQAEAAKVSAFGLPLGEAFQLQDDLAGALGNGDATGKPVGYDLRDGKHTVLVGLTIGRLPHAERAGFFATLHASATSDHKVGYLREAIERSGAADEVRRLVRSKTFEALAALAALDLEEAGKSVLRDAIVDIIPGA
ncbi:MAG: polyprenyl synthetase family protein [Bifidobacteriaceae bacterium]|nr:polyprenyl synthetase family protein [Bifidobacteriaceae bacterium]